MKKLNNKGITTIELIICFILVVTITSSMYSTVASFNQKRIIEQYKEEIYTYKNLLTKEIQNDFIKIGITSATIEQYVSGPRTTYTVKCIMKDGTKRQLIVIKQFSKSQFHPTGSESVDDYYMIKYGDPKGNFINIKQATLPASTGDLLDYPLPQLGTTKEGTRTIQDFGINNVWMTVSDSNILNIYIGFYHPELTTRYGIQIISPINYVSTGRETGNHFSLY